MSAMENIDAEQLCYTWSDVGLSTIHAGFRIRAASPGLSEIYSERVKSMDRHMRYALPPGTDRFAITPEMAPVCLALIRTDWNNEYILVHKNYLGEDGVGRLGNFFVHVIALGELAQKFSTSDAIWLWGSTIWKTNDKELDRRSNKLDPVSLKKLQSEVEHFQPDYAQIQEYLPFIIEAYLTRKNRTPLYIAAPAHQSAMIAYLIAGLANNLPRQLVAGLTFSTYEPDVTKAATEIVGTSWIAATGKEGEAAQVFSPQFYREKLAVNCDTGDHSPLQKHPQINSNPLAAHFADYATKCLLADEVDKLYELLTNAEESPTLDIEMFLSLYYTTIVKPESTTEADIEKYLADPYLSLGKLCNQIFRKSIVDRAAANRQWCETKLSPLLLALRSKAQRQYAEAFSSGHVYNIYNASATPSVEQVQFNASLAQKPRKRNTDGTTAQPKNSETLAGALFLLAKRAITDIVSAMIDVGAWREGAPSEQKGANSVAALLLLMDSCLIPQNAMIAWKLLFDEITKHPNGKAGAFLKTHWGIFPWLLEKWDNVFPLGREYDSAIHPLLTIPWNHLGEFLKLNLRQRHGQWNIFAVEKLIKDASLTPQIAQGLEENYSTEINHLLAQLLQEADLPCATSFVVRLIENSYPVRSQFAALIENLLAQLVRNPQLWTDAKNLVVTLTRSGYMGSPSYQDMVETLLSTLLKMQAQGQDLFNVLVDFGYPRKKNLVDILLRSGTSMLNLESVIERVYRTPEELNTFFINDGSNYLSTPDQIRAMKALYRKLLPFPQKLDRLFVLLDTPLHEKTILELLSITVLEGYEPARILERYGNSYLKMFQQAPQLANKVVEWYIQLVTSGYPDRFKLLCTLFTSATDYKLLDALLSSAQLTLEESREFFRAYGSLLRYFPFFYQSATIIALFSKLAQRANTLAANGQSELAIEKMHLLYTWLQPSQTQSPLALQTIERLLQAASLTSHEQIDFLEHYGEAYLLLYRSSPILKGYVNTYVSELKEDSLEQAQTKGFFAFLRQTYQHLDLDDSTRDRIQWWMIIDSYFTSPDATSKRLQALAVALYNLRLPRNEAFVSKLAKAFASCANNGNDLDIIMKQMQAVTNIKNNVVQLLYTIAEQVAMEHRRLQREIVLLPSLSFVLGNAQVSFVQTSIQEGQSHFRQVFLDTLLYNIDVLDLPKWKILNTLLTQQGLSHEAQEQWYDYLKGLQLLDKLQSSEGIENSNATPVAQPQPSSLAPANDTKPAPWYARFQSKTDPPEYRPAKKKLDDALRSRKVDLIVDKWTQYGAIIKASHPEQIAPNIREQIAASLDLVQCCSDAAKISPMSLELARKIVRVNRNVEAYNLQPSPIQNEYINKARRLIDIQEAGYSYQNSASSPSGSLPRQNSSPPTGQASQGPNPLELKPRSLPRDLPGKQSPPGATRFDID